MAAGYEREGAVSLRVVPQDAVEVGPERLRRHRRHVELRPVGVDVGAGAPSSLHPRVAEAQDAVGTDQPLDQAEGCGGEDDLLEDASFPQDQAHQFLSSGEELRELIDRAALASRRARRIASFTSSCCSGGPTFSGGRTVTRVGPVHDFETGRDKPVPHIARVDPLQALGDGSSSSPLRSNGLAPDRSDGSIGRGVTIGSMTSIVTLKERKARALAAREAALAQLKTRLAAEAARLGGCYRIFGSAARYELRPDSDIDLLADFPKDNVSAAIRAAEDACEDLGLPYDIVDQNGCGPAFLQRVLPDSMVIEGRMRGGSQ